MSNILVIGASNSKNSINRKFATWAGSLVPDAELQIPDLNELEMPIFSIEREQTMGIPEPAQKIKKMVNRADGIIISFAEHNGSYSTAFKNVFDWMSRLEKPIWSNKPMLLLAAAPGPRGAQTVLSTAVSSFPYQGGLVTGNFSLPLFDENFDMESGITDSSLNAEFLSQLDSFVENLSREALVA